MGRDAEGAGGVVEASPVFVGAMPQMPQLDHRGDVLCFQSVDAMCGMCGMVSAVYSFTPMAHQQ